MMEFLEKNVSYKFLILLRNLSLQKDIIFHLKNSTSGLDSQLSVEKTGNVVISYIRFIY